MDTTIEQTLIDTFKDFILSKDEKRSLQQLLETFKKHPSKLNFARNKAFTLVAENYRSDNASYLKSLKWLEHVIRTLDAVRGTDPELLTAYFSPGEVCAKKIIALINSSNTTIDACIFTISDNNISEALLSAHNRGIDVKIISDNDKAEDKGSDIYYLVKQGLHVKTDNSPNHMHHKFAIFDNQYLLNGSFNWTRSASKYNQENIVVSNNSELIMQFSKVFSQLWKTCVGI